MTRQLQHAFIPKQDAAPHYFSTAGKITQARKFTAIFRRSKAISAMKSKAVSANKIPNPCWNIENKSMAYALYFMQLQ